jgi:AraC family transcriptional regulator of adaptative response/methylated-DNA-[protein]-cysteine methyltransferase
MSTLLPTLQDSPIDDVVAMGGDGSKLPSFDEMYRAVERRDSSYEGTFITAVKTTGIFCRPGCTARTPRRDSVEFFATPRQALLAGYRPCKRCRPLESTEVAPLWVRGLLDRIERDPSARIRAADLRAMQINPARASRWFKQHHGMTFQAFHRARRLGCAMTALRHGNALDHAGAQSGYASLSGFRDAFARHFGQPPGRVRRPQNGDSASDSAASEQRCLVASWLDTPLGPMLAIANEDGLCLLEFVDRRMLETQLLRIRRRFQSAIVPDTGSHPHLHRIADELARYFRRELAVFTTPLSMRGSDFQLRVWNRLLKIPFGQILSYREMARDLTLRNAQRAVGRANGDNPLAIIVPCHRVIRSDGTLCGYGGGLWRKKWLLEHEQNHRA